MYLCTHRYIFGAFASYMKESSWFCFFLIEITFKGTKLVITINYEYNIYKLSFLSLSGDIITIIDFSIESLCI